MVRDMTFTTLSDDQERELHRLSKFYWKEAQRCEASKAYFAGSVMLGSALEALLMLMVNAFADEVEASGALPIKKGKVLPLVDWDLGKLLRAAKAAGWLPSGLDLGDSWNARKAEVGDYAEVSRTIRNLIHPGCYLKDHSNSRVTARYLRR